MIVGKRPRDREALDFECAVFEDATGSLVGNMTPFELWVRRRSLLKRGGKASKPRRTDPKARGPHLSRSHVIESGHLVGQSLEKRTIYRLLAKDPDRLRWQMFRFRVKRVIEEDYAYEVVGMD